MVMKRILIEDLPKEPVVESYPDEAYAYIDEKFRILRHHNESVKDMTEEDSVDPELLELAISLAETSIPFDEDTKEAILEHLYMHRQQIEAKKHKKYKDKNTNGEEGRKKRAKCSDKTLLKIIASKKPEIKNAMARIANIETAKVSIIYYLDIIDDTNLDGPEDGVFIPVEVVYDGAGNLMHVCIFESCLTPSEAEDLLNFISMLQDMR